jgi:hypothetical protein
MNACHNCDLFIAITLSACGGISSKAPPTNSNADGMGQTTVELPAQSIAVLRDVFPT